MRKWILLSVLVFPVFHETEGQAVNTIVNPPLPTGVAVFLTDGAGRPYREKEHTDIEGSPYLLEGWYPGYVRLKNGKSANGLPLRFDLYKNQLFFQKDGIMMEFTEPVHEFMIRYFHDGEILASHWRNEYAPVDNNKEEFFYEVLVDGRMTLLDSRRLAIGIDRRLGLPEKRRFVERHQLYACLPDGRMLRLKRSKAAILNDLPQWAAKIQKIANEKKLRLKTISDLTVLFTALNDMDH